MLTISALAKRTRVSSKTLRYWESLGLLPKAARSHTGYRLFPPEAATSVLFIRKAKSVGLSLREISKAMHLARNGGNPCPEVARWAGQKAAMVEQQIQALSALRSRLRHFSRVWSRKMSCPRVGPEEICCLIEQLPAPNPLKGGKRNAIVVIPAARRVSRAHH